MIGIQKIRWSGKGNVDKSKSRPNVTLTVLPKSDIGFVVDKWFEATTEAHKKKNVTWILQDKNRKEIRSIQKGPKEEFTLNIPSELCGPYPYYIEASLSGEIDRKNNTGLWIMGACTPKIKSSKWSVSLDGKDVRKQQFKYGQLIYLNLETEGLNGSKNLTIEIYKKNEGFTITGGRNGTNDDKLVATITSVDVIDGEVNLKIGNTANWFVHAKEDEEEFYVKVKTSWGKYVSDGKDTIHARFLRMKKEQVTKAVEPSTNNTPLKIGDAETNFLNYNACRYNLITASYAKTADKEGNEQFEVEIFNSKTPPSSSTNLFFPVIAGVRQGRREVKLKLDTKTNQCQYTGLNNDHKTNVIDLSKIEDAIVIESKTKVNDHKIYDKSGFSSSGLNFGKEEEGHVDTDDDNEISNSHTNVNGGLNLGGGGYKRTSKTSLFQDEKRLVKDTESDTEVLLDIGYNYGDESILTLVKYIWPLNKNIIQYYPIFLHTCAFDKKLDIQVYPDIKWILQFSYDCDPEEFQKMRKDKYDEYLVRVEKLDSKSKPLELDERIKKLDSEIEQAKIDKKNATDKKKKSYEKLINKLEKLNNKNKAAKEKYKKNIKKEKKVYKRERPDLFNFKENIESGLSDLVLALHVEYDRPGESIEITASYKKYVNLVKQILEVKNTIELILDGKKKSKKKLDKKYKQIDEKKASENLKALGEALKGRPVFSLNIIPPSLAAVGSWYAENPKDINSKKVGIVGEIDILAKPLIGAEGVLDFLGLAQKAHPIARGVITLIDVAAVGGIGPKITLELVISGQIEISGKWRGNSSSGTTNFNQRALATDAEDDSPLTVSGIFCLEIGGKIEISKKANSFIFGTIKGYANAAFEVKTGITLSGAIKADDKGVFIDPLLTFHGLTVSGIASAGYVAENSDGGEYSSGSIEGAFELVLMNEYEGSFEDSNGKKIQWYVN